MLEGLLTRHINLYYMLRKMRKARNPSCKRYDVENETSEHILCECLVLEKIRMQTLCFARMDLRDETKQYCGSCKLSLVFEKNEGNFKKN